MKIWASPASFVHTTATPVIKTIVWAVVIAILGCWTLLSSDAFLSWDISKTTVKFVLHALNSASTASHKPTASSAKITHTCSITYAIPNALSSTMLTQLWHARSVLMIATSVTARVNAYSAAKASSESYPILHHAVLPKTGIMTI